MSIIICFLIVVYLASLDINFYNFAIIIGYAHFALANFISPSIKKTFLGVITALIATAIYFSPVDQLTLLSATLITFTLHSLLDEYFTPERDILRIIATCYLGASTLIKANGLGFDMFLLNTRSQVEMTALIFFHITRWYFPQKNPPHFLFKIAAMNALFFILAIAYYGNVLSLDNSLDSRIFWSFSNAHFFMTVHFRPRKFTSINDVTLNWSQQLMRFSQFLRSSLSRY